MIRPFLRSLSSETNAAEVDVLGSTRYASILKFKGHLDREPAQAVDCMWINSDANAGNILFDLLTVPFDSDFEFQ